jgi:hypothetical protein
MKKIGAIDVSHSQVSPIIDPNSVAFVTPCGKPSKWQSHTHSATKRHHQHRMVPMIGY